MSEKLYMFDCPVHGKETGVHCFRAFDKQYLGKWLTYKIVIDDSVNTDEVEAFIHGLLNPDPNVSTLSNASIWLNEPDA